ncbi:MULTISPECIES: distal tail protein Dit [Bacillus]|uniref:Phage tail protein n=1 Tax=Bacillus pseudomycoides TaxID=64104 RepID=A0A1Y3MHS0_9BACI|nr:distal tail protein Dit [Bacillus pseudomycoides]OUM49364.1 hypothetical protein BW425_08080 [Bacillus pseudomycoides]
MSSFTFNNKRKSFITIGKGWKRPTWAPLKRNLLQVPNYPGARLINTETDIRVLSIPVGIIVPKGGNLEKIKEEIADWLITDQPCELIFDVEKDRTYMAVVDESFDPDEFVDLGTGTLKFICPMPYKLGAEKQVELNNTQLGIDITNKGTVDSDMRIEIEVDKPSTYLDVWKNDKDYFRIGNPLPVTSVPKERQTKIYGTDFADMLGWQPAVSSDNSDVSGSMKIANEYLVPESFGAITDKYHGPSIRRSIPGGPVQDFVLETYVSFGADTVEEIGKIEIQLLDNNSKVVCRTSIEEKSYSERANWGRVALGHYTHPKWVDLIHETGDYRDTWNDFYGRLYVARVSNMWMAYIAKFDDRPGAAYAQDGAARYFEWYDTEGWHMNPVSQIQIGMQMWSTAPPVKVMEVDLMKFYRINREVDPAESNLFDVGDKILIDSSRNLVSVNGKSCIDQKEIFSEFLKLSRGKNHIEVHPSWVGKKKIKYRERYR